MENKELVIVGGRARRMPVQMYVASIVEKGTENDKMAQFLVYSPNVTILKILVNDHNEMVKIRKEKLAQKSK